MIPFIETQNWKSNAVTTAERTTLGIELGSNNKYLQVYDSDLDKRFTWDGTTWVETEIISGSAIEQTYSAGAAVGGQRVVMLNGGTAIHFDPIEANVGFVLGISNNAAGIGDPVKVIMEGSMVSVGWGLTPNTVYYASSTGLLTTVVPITGVLQRVGVAVDANTLQIRFSEPIILI